MHAQTNENQQQEKITQKARPYVSLFDEVKRHPKMPNIKPSHSNQGNLQRMAIRRAISNQAAQPPIQTKLKIGQPNDIYEQEANRVAEQVIRMPEPKAHRQPLEKEEGEELIQGKITEDVNPEVPPTMSLGIQSLEDSGRPLSESERSFFESRFGYDLSHVRLHTNENAANLTQALGARAFTIGKDIYFGSREYTTHTEAGRRVLAHELTHAIQQKKVFPTNPHVTIKQRSNIPMFMCITDQESTALLARFRHWADQMEIMNESLGYGRRTLGSDQVAVIHIYDSRGQRHEFAGYHLTLQRARHAEQEAVGQVTLTRAQARGARMYIVISDTPCDDCRQAIRGLAADLRLNPRNVEVFEVTRRSVSDPDTYVRGTTALRTRHRHPNIPLELRSVSIFPRRGGGGSGGSLHGLARRRQALIAELDQTTGARQALAMRIRIFSVTFSVLFGLIGQINAVSDILQMMSSGTTLRRSQRTAIRILSQAQEALEMAQSIDPGATFHLQTVSLISDAQVASDTESLFSLDSELYDFSVSLDPIVSEYNRLASALSERAQALRETSDMFLRLAHTPQIGSTAGSASYVAMHTSLQRLSGTLRSAAARYRQAHQILNFAMESANRYSQQANQAAWRIFGESIIRALAALRSERVRRETAESESVPMHIPAYSTRDMSETEL